MLDVGYVVISIVFFALMLAYVRGCERIAHRTDGSDEAQP